MRIDQVLTLAREVGVDRLDAQLVMAHHLHRSRSWLIAHGDEALQPQVEAAIRSDLRRRSEGMPLAYLVGRKEFRGIELCVSESVLIPRPETELLVDWALECLLDAACPRILDLGTGSGAVAIALALARPDACVDATDVDGAALEVARANALAKGASVAFEHGSWWHAVAGRTYRLVVSNPPYVAEGDPHLPILVHEPRHALVSGAHGLDALSELAAGAALHLTPGGWLLLEHGHDQGQRVRALLTAAGLVDATTRKDLSGLDRYTGARVAA